MNPSSRAPLKGFKPKEAWWTLRGCLETAGHHVYTGAAVVGGVVVVPG